MAEVVSLLTIDARGAEQGSALYVRSMQAAQSAVDRLRDAEERAKTAREKGVAMMIGQGDTIARTSRQWEKLKASLDPVIFATKELEKAQLQADAAVRRGIASQQEAAQIVDQVRRKYAGALGTVNDNAPKGLAQHEVINLSRQVQDVVTMLASGSSPMQVISTQAAQIFDIFASSQATVGGFFRQLLGWLGPVAPAFMLATAAVGAFYAAFSVGSGRADVERSLYGVGRAAGLTGDELNRLAKQAADSGDITVESAREMAAEFTKTGRIAPVIMNDLIRLSKSYALTTQQDLLPAAKELAGAYADPVRGAETLNQKLGFLDATMQTAIRRSAEMGDRLRAQKLLTEGVASSVEQAEAAQSKWNRAWEKYISMPLARAKEAVGTALLPEDSIQKQERMLRELASLNSQIAGAKAQDAALRPDQAIADMERRRRQLEAELKATSDLATARKELVERNDRSLTVQKTFESANRDVLSRDTLNGNLNQFEMRVAEIKKELGEVTLDPGRNSARIGDLNQQLSDYQLQIQRYSAALKDYSGLAPGMTVEQDKQRRLLELQAKAVNDVTLAQKAATEADRVRIELRGTENSAVERNRMAEEARQRVLLQGQQVGVEQKRNAQDNIDAANAETEAMRKGGVAAAELARLKAQALREVRGTDQSADERYKDLLLEAHAKVTRELTEQTTRQRDQLNVSRSVVDQAQKQGLSEQVIAQLMQRKLELQQSLERLKGAGASDATMAQAERELVALKDQELSIDQKRQALGLIYGQTEQIAGLQQEISLIGRSADERNRLIAVMRAEQDLRRAGIPLASAEGQQYIANASTIAGLTTVRDGLTEIQSLGKDALKGFISDLRSGKSFGDAFLGVLNRMGDKLLDLTLNGLFGGGTSATSAIGSLGKLIFGASANGNVFGPTGLHAFALGGAFTNGIVDRPTLFPFARGIGLMGEAGPEAIMPLRRGADGRLGVSAPAYRAPAYSPPLAANSNGGSRQVEVKLYDRTTGGVTAQATQTERPDGSLEVLVDLMEARMADRAASGRSSLNDVFRRDPGAMRG